MKVKQWVSMLLGAAMVVAAAAFAAQEAVVPPPAAPSRATVKQTPAKPLPRETRMRATGTVKEISADILRMERTVTFESMEFILERPEEKIAVGDKVTVSYIRKDDRNIAKRVTKALPKKKESPSAGGPVKPPLPPVKK